LARSRYTDLMILGIIKIYKKDGRWLTTTTTTTATEHIEGVKTACMDRFFIHLKKLNVAKIIPKTKFGYENSMLLCFPKS